MEKFSYIDKGTTTSSALSRAGFQLEVRDGVWYTQDPAGAEAFLASYDPTDDILEHKRAQAKAECKRRIFEVVDQETQANLSALNGADLLPADDRAVYLLGLQWIQEMITMSRTIPATENDIYADASWPVAGADIIALGEAY